ncbi:MAG: 3-methyl-2-oxobutanoate hydroxymethyltransferase [Planctomycetia bacterium]|nr:3-methyl-2-oxobutanoate hydroxymethyltransferase [Planctomycetia bacterium]
MPEPSSRPLTIRDLLAAKQERRPLSMVTAYDWPTGRLVDAAGVDCVLVGDSVAMVVAGRPTTVSATLEQMLYHGEIVARAVSRAVVIVDLPFPLQHLGVHSAIEAAARILKETGCQAIKLEGTAGQQEVIAGIVAAGIPVMGHVGLRPQAVHQLGGYRVQRDRDQLLADATAAAEAGACGVVLECIPAEIAAEITAELAVPTIGIGAGPACDGQVLVLHDLIGLSLDKVPRFVRSYADMKGTLTEAVSAWRRDVEAGDFGELSSGQQADESADPVSVNDGATTQHRERFLAHLVGS